MGSRGVVYISGAGVGLGVKGVKSGIFGARCMSMVHGVVFIVQGLGLRIQGFSIYKNR